MVLIGDVMKNINDIGAWFYWTRICILSGSNCRYINSIFPKA